MTTFVARGSAMVFLACLIGACTRVGHIQQTAPIRSMTFTGSHVAVAKCVHQRLGGRIYDEGFGEKYVIYDAVKTRQADGLTHFAVTVGMRDATRGFVEWRVLRPTRAPGPNQPPVPRLSDAALQEYWRPVQECALEAQAPK